MKNFNFVLKGEKPLMSFFLQPYPKDVYGEEEKSIYNSKLQINENIKGVPLFARTSAMPTSCYTPGHTIKSGYTPSGKWRPSKFVPGKTDKRAGK